MTLSRGSGASYSSNVTGSIAIEVLAAQPAGAQRALDVLSAVAEPVRWTILNTLAARPSCVCNLQEHVPIAANLLSYHLKVLREAGLVTSTKRGRWVDYALAPDAAERMAAALPTAATAQAPCDANQP